MNCEATIRLQNPLKQRYVNTIHAYYNHHDAVITKKSSKAASVSRFSLAVILGLSLAIGCHTLITIFF